MQPLEHLNVGGKVGVSTPSSFPSLIKFLEVFSSKTSQEDSISSESLLVLDESMQNFKAHRVSEPIDLSDFDF